MSDNDCPWCHGTDTQFCENPECRPTQPQPVPAQYEGQDDGACLGTFVVLSIDLMLGVLCVAVVAVYKLFT